MALHWYSTLKKASLSSLRAPMGLLRSLKVAGLVRSANRKAHNYVHINSFQHVYIHVHVHVYMYTVPRVELV